MIISEQAVIVMGIRALTEELQPLTQDFPKNPPLYDLFVEYATSRGIVVKISAMFPYLGKYLPFLRVITLDTLCEHHVPTLVHELIHNMTSTNKDKYTYLVSRMTEVEDEILTELTCFFFCRHLGIDTFNFLGHYLRWLGATEEYITAVAPFVVQALYEFYTKTLPFIGEEFRCSQ